MPTFALDIEHNSIISPHVPEFVWKKVFWGNLKQETLGTGFEIYLTEMYQWTSMYQKTNFYLQFPMF